MPPPVKVGLMGYGASTKIFHLPYILPNPDLEVVAFLQRAEAPRDKANVEAGKHCTVDHPKAKHYRTAEDFLKDDEIELVVVCTSSATHFELGVRQAFQRESINLLTTSFTESNTGSWQTWYPPFCFPREPRPH